jgi:hypothetical protein
MSNVARSALLSILVGAGLACGLSSNPLAGVPDIAATAQAVVSAIPSGVPNLPDVTGYLDPTGAPVKDWNGIPVMTQATAGQEFNKNTYSFKAGSVAAADVQAFYNDKLKALGWSSSFSGAAGEGAVMAFTKGSSLLTVVVTKNGKDTVVLLITQ